MKPLICNLKSNHDLKEMIKYKEKLKTLQEKDILLCPSDIYLTMMHSKNYSLCSQNVSKHEKGNYTGSISASALKSIGIKNVLIGHSEIKDSLESKIEKIKQTVKEKLNAYIILSDTKEYYDYQYTSLKLLGQIRAMLSQIKESDYKYITFIYEPSWLVGTDTPIIKEDLENIITFMKKELYLDYHRNFKFYYGGGLNKNNINEYYHIDCIDGLLLGTFSNNPENILNFVKNIENSTKIDTTIHN